MRGTSAIGKQQRGQFVATCGGREVEVSEVDDKEGAGEAERAQERRAAQHCTALQVNDSLVDHFIHLCCSRSTSPTVIVTHPDLLSSVVTQLAMDQPLQRSIQEM